MQRMHRPDVNEHIDNTVNSVCEDAIAYAKRRSDQEATLTMHDDYKDIKEEELDLGADEMSAMMGGTSGPASMNDGDRESGDVDGDDLGNIDDLDALSAPSNLASVLAATVAGRRGGRGGGASEDRDDSDGLSLAV